MITTFNEAIDKVLAHEGGYSNDKDDPGNWTGGAPGKGELKGTKYGIAANSYGHLDIKNLTKEQAKKIYEQDYWLKSYADKLPSDVRYIHFDTAINMGLGGAAKILQESIGGIAVDGAIGPKTLAAASRTNLYKYAMYRMAKYMRIIGKRNTSAKYANGWCNRVLDIVNQ
jgi:lysozyme family protein